MVNYEGFYKGHRATLINCTSTVIGSQTTWHTAALAY